MSNYVMTFTQYRQYENGEKTLREIKRERKELSRLEDIATKIVENPKLKRLVVFTVASLNYASEVLADTTDAFGKINKGGSMILGVIQTVGYWLCVLSCIMEILKTVMNGSTKDVGKVMVKYLLIFGSLYLMPWLFDLIKAIFE